jgi:hypothetical protein
MGEQTHTLIMEYNNSATNACEWSVSQSGHFILKERIHSTKWIGGRRSDGP